MRCIHIVGNRPQFVKLALLHRAIGAYTSFAQKIIHTGQHYDASMSGVFFQELNIPSPDYMLNVNQLPHHSQIGRMTEQIGDVLVKEKECGVIIYGDTNTSLAGALAAKKNNIPIAHVEAGIRTYDETMPEESNRYLIDRMAELNFCPTYLCEKNLIDEGLGRRHAKKIINTGDIMLDAWLYAAKQPQLHQTDLPATFTLATIHREENNSSPEKLSEIVRGLNAINEILPVIMPCHPKTQKKIDELGIPVLFNIRSPFSYMEMMQVLNKASYVITDSGGFCREAFFSQKPSLVIMEHPFWPEITEHGTCLQTKAEMRNIVDNFALLRKTPPKFNVDIFGRGNAARLMADVIAQEWKK